MDLSFFQVFAGLAMIIVTAVLLFAYRSYLDANSERRMLSMIDSIGLDPAIASNSDLETIMGEVRQRCRSCTSEDVCERWLTCNEKGDNDFCPNAETFAALKNHV